MVKGYLGLSQVLCHCPETASKLLLSFFTFPHTRHLSLLVSYFSFLFFYFSPFGRFYDSISYEPSRGPDADMVRGNVMQNERVEKAWCGEKYRFGDREVTHVSAGR
jgi:hypothetical protein